MLGRNEVCELVARSAPDPVAARQTCLRLRGRLAQELVTCSGPLLDPETHECDASAILAAHGADWDAAMNSGRYDTAVGHAQGAIDDAREMLRQAQRSQRTGPLSRRNVSQELDSSRFCRAESHVLTLVAGGNFEDAETAALDLWDDIAGVFRDIQKREAAPRPGSMRQEFEQLGVIPGTLEVHPTVCQSMQGATYLIGSAKEYEEAEDYLIDALKEADNLLAWVQKSERVLSRAGVPWSG
ncbi:MAG: hypothetical protein KGJ23_08255 [Euryarchaeota archaeon]|nr:hypothetical protein [Euryarchaeota archaeon]MDE1836594.1 hypothetical protein [Euryarchaeota archaeon]MDE1879211.1 hypothetical protein [Euryarchaeota archaeon]MDE2044564.1 hypothetical protein [Thermoplasmata archaeon]